jgi:hypothetical protein
MNINTIAPTKATVATIISTSNKENETLYEIEDNMLAIAG